MRAQRPAAPEERIARGDDLLGRAVVLDPVDDGRQQVEPIEGGAAAAMTHSRQRNSRLQLRVASRPPLAAASFS
jgi:hypothetical protein